jgi:DNA polymerase I-like protein with 3'-5' exonuclease and polymerase domains
VPWYFNFQEYPGLATEYVLGEFHKEQLCEMLAVNEAKKYLSNAKYDMHMLWCDWKVELQGDIYCSLAQGRVAYNDYHRYGLEESLERIGRKKDDKVKAWLKANGGTTKVKIEGKQTEDVYFHFEKAPWDLIVPYAEDDAVGSFYLGEDLDEKIRVMTEQQTLDIGPHRTPLLVAENEARLTKTLWRMERTGVLIDKEYTRKGFEYEQARNKAKRDEFERATGFPFVDSGVLFSKLFAESDGERFVKTKKDNDSFKSDILQTFYHPAAQIILDIRDSKSKSDFYTNFLRFADRDGYVHGNFKQGGTRHGRMSASDPNLQNFSNPDEDDEGEIVGEYQVRGCVIPPPGHYIASIDYDAMEYRFLLELAAILMGHTGKLLEMVRDEGLNVHKATAQLCEGIGVKVHYKEAKISNFLTIFGGGVPRLAAQLKVPLARAQTIQSAIFRGCPEMLRIRDTVKNAARQRGYVVNWRGRRSYFPGGRGTHKALNYVISGGCADVNKIALNQVDEYLKNFKTRSFASIHDELDLYVPFEERGIEQEIAKIMGTAYAHKYIQLTASASTSDVNLAMV